MTKPVVVSYGWTDLEQRAIHNNKLHRILPVILFFLAFDLIFGAYTYCHQESLPPQFIDAFRQIYYYFLIPVIILLTITYAICDKRWPPYHGQHRVYRVLAVESREAIAYYIRQESGFTRVAEPRLRKQLQKDLKLKPCPLSLSEIELPPTLKATVLFGKSLSWKATFTCQRFESNLVSGFLDRLAFGTMPREELVERLRNLAVIQLPNRLRRGSEPEAIAIRLKALANHSNDDHQEIELACGYCITGVVITPPRLP